MGDTLTEGQKLEKGGSLTSNNGAYTLTLQDDGNLVLYARDEAVWSTSTNGQDVVRAEVQTDGNFVLYTPEKPVWHTDTKGKKDVKLVLQDDRNLVLYAADGPAWSSKTDTTEPPPPAPEAAAPEHPSRGPTPWSPVTPCGRSPSGSTATATSTSRSPMPAASPTLT
ncbi:mannose-binding lectin [Mycolicibacterium conceptionense]|uniref:Mannose-binding lectin n=1 Tax=Mycolicibacterium conceptionense TaxID=451644 RepID=A0A0U1DNC4_9MYCO|nr:mannose-binding lectin [Mycolicibacterium conceptionense]